MICSACGNTGMVWEERPMFCRACDKGARRYRRAQRAAYADFAASDMTRWTFESWRTETETHDGKADAYQRVISLTNAVITMQQPDHALVLSGDYGVGKSGLAASAMNEILWFMGGLWFDVLCETNSLRHHPDLLTAPFVVFDHIRLFEATADLLWYRIVPRLQSGLPTILTTPHSFEEWEAALPPEHLAVIRRHAQWITVGGASLRNTAQFDPLDVI